MFHQIVDVTLRDGGYRNHFTFPPAAAQLLVQTLGASGIQFIEVGYRNGPLKKHAKMGPSAQSSAPYLRDLVESAGKATLVVMAHPRNITAADLVEMRKCGVGMVRICVDIGRLQESLELVSAAKALGFVTSANFTRVTYLGKEELIGLMARAEKAGADLVYFADSNGHMIPEEVECYTRFFRERLGIGIGFHAHNNLSLALANSTAALGAGADFIDCSLRGMGRGAGNLATEVLLSYFDRVGQTSPAYDLIPILELADAWEKMVLEEPMRHSSAEILFGAGNLSADFEAPLSTVSQEQQVPQTRLTYALSKLRPRVPPDSSVLARLAAEIRGLGFKKLALK